MHGETKTVADRAVMPALPATESVRTYYIRNASNVQYFIDLMKEIL